MKSAILLITGFGVPEHSHPDAGLYPLRDRLAGKYCDRTEHWLAVRAWHSKQFAYDVAEIDRLNPKRICIAAHSWGCGYGVIEVCRLLTKCDRSVDSLVLIDPVLYSRFGRLTDSVLPGDKPFAVPPNVVRIALARTVNYRGIWTPWGRDVSDPRVSRRMVFGSDVAFVRWGYTVVQPALRINDGSVEHGNIDNDSSVHDMVVDEFSSTIGESA